jgi:glucose-1-phosphate cytidylyltransferase
MRGDTPIKKELVEVGGHPILWHVMKIYATYGHTRFVLALGYRAEDVKRYFLEYEPMRCDFTITLGDSDALAYHRPNKESDWKVTLANTGPEALKGQRLFRVAKYIETDTFFVTYGDGVGDVDLDALLKFHRQHGRLATVTGVRPPSPYGVIRADKDGRVTAFGEKPPMEDWINGGFMVFERGVLDYLSDSDEIDLETDVLPRLTAEGQLSMYRHAGFWRKMDTYKEAMELDRFWHEGAPWKTWD